MSPLKKLIHRRDRKARGEKKLNVNAKFAFTCTKIQGFSNKYQESLRSPRTLR